MSPTIIGVLGFIVLFALFALRLPVGIGLAAVGFGGLCYLISPHAAMSKIAITLSNTLLSYDLAVLPLFLFMAFIIFTSRLGSDLYNLAARWVGHQPGGIAMATITGCAALAAISADNLSPATTMSLVAFPEMKRFNYDRALSVGSIAVGGTLGILIPPSAMFITYGLLTETSIGKLFIGGIVPGVILAFFYMVTIYLLCRWKPSLGPPGPRFTFKEKVVAFRTSGELLVLIILLLVGIVVGWFTPTEAGAMGAFLAILISLIRRRLNWQSFKEAIITTTEITGMVYCMLIGAFIFQYFSAVSQIPFWLGDTLSRLAVPPMVVVAGFVLVYLLLGCIMDGLAMMLCTIPIFFPVVQALGIDPVWFGIVITIMMMMAIITPPVGINLFVISAACKEPLTTVYKGVLPFIVADVVHVALMFAFPSLVLFLPGLMR